MATANDILRIARGEIGTQGGADKHNKYTDEYGVYCDWCVIFVWWVFRHANASKLFGQKCALCSKLYNQHTHQAVTYDELKPGDIVFFDWTGNQTAFNHVGIVEKKNGNTIGTIEGNTSNAVLRRTRKRIYVSHAYRPAYQEGEQPILEQVQVQLAVLRNGSIGTEVKTLQRLLKSYGYSMAPYGIDGDFGSLTERRLREYQKKQGIEQTGVTDLTTWNKLLKG